MKRTRLYVGLTLVLALALVGMAQVTGKYFGFTPDRFWDNNGVLATDNQIRTVGSSNGLRVGYSEARYATLAQASTGAVTLTVTGAASSSHDTLTVSRTGVTAYTQRCITGAMTMPAAMTSGNLVGVRGSTTMPTGSSITGGYLYGVQGKIITNTGTINNGSGMTYGVMGQLDVTGATVTAGYVAAIGADIFGLSSGTKAVDLFYGQHADGGTGYSMFRAYGKFQYVFCIDDNSGGQVSLTGTPGAVTGGTGWIKVIINGTVRYIPLAESVS